jgi:hypothetical protein
MRGVGHWTRALASMATVCATVPVSGCWSCHRLTCRRGALASVGHDDDEGGDDHGDGHGWWCWVLARWWWRCVRACCACVCVCVWGRGYLYPVNNVEWEVFIDSVVERQLLSVHDDPQSEVWRRCNSAVVYLARNWVDRLSHESPLYVHHSIDTHLQLSESFKRW